MRTAPSVAPTTRAWLAVAALGAGLLHAALAPGAPLLVAVPLVVTAAAELAWAVATLLRDRPPFFRSSLWLALVPVAGWAALATLGATASGGPALSLQPLPMAVASLLDLAVAGTVAIVLRRGRPAPRESGALRFVTVLTLSAAAVSALAIPALGVTEAGGAAAQVHLQHSGHH
jgi:hypothetical protein